MEKFDSLLKNPNMVCIDMGDFSTAWGVMDAIRHHLNPLTEANVEDKFVCVEKDDLENAIKALEQAKPAVDAALRKFITAKKVGKYAEI